MNVAVEVLKNKQDKYIFCRLEVEARPICYFYAQKRPHRTHRWLNAEQWAAFDEKMQQLMLSNEIDELRQYSLTYKLKGNVCLQLTQSKISKNSIYETLNNKEIHLDDIINVIDCKIVYQDNTEACSDTPIKCEINGIELSSDGTPHRGFETPDNEKIIIKSEDEVYVISNSDNSLLTPLPSNATQQSDSDTIVPTEVLKIVYGGNSPSPTFPFSNNNISPLPTQDASTESSDFLETLNFPKNRKHGKSGDSSKARTPRKTDLKLVDDNENDDLVVPATPSEKRKRKLYHSGDKNEKSTEKHEHKNSNGSPKQKQPKTEESRRDEGQRKSSRTESSSHSRGGASSSSKNKKSKRHRDRSKSPQEKNSITRWIIKDNAKEDECVDKRSSRDDDKPKSSKQSSDSKYSSSISTRRHKHDEAVPSCSSKPHKASPHKKSKPIEAAMSNEEKLKLIKISEQILEQDRKLIEGLKEFLPKEPKKPILRTLRDMPADEILATYEEYRECLEELFITKKSQKKYTSADGVNFNFVCDLVDNAVQQKLMDKLSEFERNHTATPKYGDLLSNVLMPEWLIRVFMKKFGMDRSASIAHINQQNEYNAFISLSPEELDKLAPKKK